ncbi:hypothetical protein ABZU86_00285 [Streptomyces sp. NPDC005271]|uniref:hypothetical protein n=1 Tax=unclassified Streptomyces TaxID=2593676 RepID=UPI0033A37E64
MTDHVSSQAGLGVGLMRGWGCATRTPGLLARSVRSPEPVRVISAATRETSLERPALRSMLAALSDAATAS